MCICCCAHCIALHCIAHCIRWGIRCARLLLAAPVLTLARACRYESRGYSAPSFGVNCPPLDVGSSELVLLQETCVSLLSDTVATVAVSAAVSVPRLLPCFHPETRASIAFSCFSIIQRLVRESNYWGTYHSLGSVYVDVLSSALRVLPALQEFGCGALSPPALDSFLGTVVYELAVQIRCVMPAVLCALARGSGKTDGSADVLEQYFLAFLKDDQSEVRARPRSCLMVLTRRNRCCSPASPTWPASCSTTQLHVSSFRNFGSTARRGARSACEW